MVTRRPAYTALIVATCLLLPACATSDPSTGRTASSEADQDLATHPSHRGWRVESFHGVQFRVPPTWGWGPTPWLRDSQLVYCGAGALTVPTGDGVKFSPYAAADPTAAYVGRPDVYSTDTCGGRNAEPPKPPYAWLGSPLQPGSEHLSDADGTSFTRTTTEVAGVRVTVADQDPSELTAILASAEPARVDANGCPRTMPDEGNPPSPSSSPSVVEGAQSLSICIYGPGHNGQLTYSTQLIGNAARHAVRGIIRTPRTTPPRAGRCGLPASGRVALLAHSRSQTSQFKVHLSGCTPGGYSDPWGHFHPFTKPNVRNWAIHGVSLMASPGQMANLIAAHLPHELLKPSSR